MREIKFKAKLVTNGIWVYGYYFWSEKENKHYIIGESIDYGFNKMEVDSKTVGQYTGLKDKNDDEIYEGDIFTTEHTTPNFIHDKNGNLRRKGTREFSRYWEIRFKFNKGIHGYCKNIDDPQNYTNDPTIDIYELQEFEELEIIGNIHENPELLEVSS